MKLLCAIGIHKLDMRYGHTYATQGELTLIRGCSRCSRRWYDMFSHKIHARPVWVPIDEDAERAAREAVAALGKAFSEITSAKDAVEPAHARPHRVDIYPL